MPLGDEVGLGGQDLGHGGLLLRIAGAELADHAVNPDSFLPAFGGQGLDLVDPGLGRDRSPVVHAARQDMVLAAHGVGLGIDAWARNDEHADLFRVAGDDGVGGQGGAQVDGADVRALAVLEDGAQGLGDGRQQIVVIRGNLGHGQQVAVPDAHAVRVGSSDIDTDKHRADPCGERLGPPRLPEAGISGLCFQAPCITRGRCVKTNFSITPIFTGLKAKRKHNSVNGGKSWIKS